MKIKSFIYYWLPVIIYAGLIFYFSSLSQPLPSGIPSFNYMDLLLHASEYFVLSALLLRAFLYSAAKRPYMVSIIVSALYGISDEIHQLFVPGRVFAASDMLANAFGASLVLLYFLIRKHTKSYKTKAATE